MDRDALVTMVEDYGKRWDLTTEITTYFIPLAEARLGRDLRSSENFAEREQAEASNPIAVPSDFGAFYSLEYAGDSGYYTLTSLDRHSINDWKAAGGSPLRYHYAPSAGIDVRPFVAGDYRLRYYSRPALTAGSSTNAVLTRYPNLYLYATLVELHIFQVATQRAQEALDIFTAEVRAINRAADRERSDKPAMRRA